MAHFLMGLEIWIFWLQKIPSTPIGRAKCYPFVKKNYWMIDLKNEAYAEIAYGRTLEFFLLRHSMAQSMRCFNRAP
jgi:hypothetical protein